jgi:hypothetical protein
MSVVSRQRYLIPLSNGETLNVLVEEQANPSLYKYAAVQNDWDERCIFETADTVDAAVQQLAEMLHLELPDNWRDYELSDFSALAAA